MVKKGALQFALLVWVISVQVTIKHFHAISSWSEEPGCVCVTVSAHTRCKGRKKATSYQFQATESWVSTAGLPRASLWVYVLLWYLRLLPVCSGRRQRPSVTRPHGLSCCSPAGTDACFANMWSGLRSGCSPGFSFLLICWRVLLPRWRV